MLMSIYFERDITTQFWASTDFTQFEEMNLDI